MSSALQNELCQEPAALIAAALPMPVLMVDERDRIVFVNPAAEQFFDTGAGLLLRHRIEDLVPFGSPLTGLIAQARERGAPAAERAMDLSTPRHGERVADAMATPMGEPRGAVVVTLQERSLAQRIDRQLLHRGAVRSMHGMAAVLAHEIKNPLAGIRGAAQLLEEAVPDSERNLTQLICAETDRIRNLIDRMESFGDTRGIVRNPINIHAVLARVRSIAAASFAREATFVENFDPSLPPVPGDFDQLVQVFLNLVRNAADAAGGGEITLTTAYRPGVRFGATVAGERLSLPLEITVRDNGSGIPPELMPHVFDPFVTTKPFGTGLGLALVAKIVGDHGGVVECESAPQRTVFRILFPKAQDTDHA
ncbi:MAG TPA: ATP-binding protein [Rhizomicrobium sp.]|jgi:two-component system nitrogen regulation sensor histidine kinase GlnL|nr:ATP-binding protein [Rhizomicrobium sp.]